MIDITHSRRLFDTVVVAVFGLTLTSTCFGYTFGGTGSGKWSSQNVVADCDWDTGTSDINGQIYTIDQSGICTFKGLIANGEKSKCALHMEYDLGAAPACVKSGNHWAIDIHAQCKDFASTASVDGSLTCDNTIQEHIGLASKGGDYSFKAKDCSVFGGPSATLLSHRITYSDNLCTQLLVDTTRTSGQACHADNGVDLTAPAICIVNGTATGTNTGYTEKSNNPNAACTFNDPWNADCSGNKDQGVVKAVFLGIPPAESDPGIFAIDVSSINKDSVTLNDRSAKKCQQKGDNLECTFLSCKDGEFIASGGTVSMQGSFGTNGNTVQCEGTVRMVQ
jgi:hypothetical protein